jgi:hypothetical protein
MIVSRLRLRLVWLTLFALGVQIAVADFHHHVVHGTGIQARAMTAGLCGRSPTHPCAPLQKDHDGCALCWATAIAATSLTPSLFAVPTPSLIIGSELVYSNTVPVRLVRSDGSRARGPPKADLV